MSREENETDYGLVMPFVVVKDQGGPYDAPSFVAGWECAVIDEFLHNAKRLGASLERTVHTPVVPQLDLIAMKHGYTLATEPWDEAPDEWTFATFEIARVETSGD